MSKKTVAPLINDLEQLRQLPEEQLPQLAATLRREILESVSRNGGHLASSLGAVELIIALHRIFNTPDEKIFFDVGHQAYAHKLLTGRREQFANLRRNNGVSGFTNPEESEFDPVVSGHAGVALSAALGVAAAAPDCPNKVIAVVGDGAAGCGVTLEALNHVSSCPGSRRLIVVLNDNRMSISANVGAVSQALNRVIAAASYNRFRAALKRFLLPVPRLKRFFSRLYDAGKSVFLPPAVLFESFGFRYFGAVNGHDFKQLLPMLQRLRDIDGPVLLHVITEKGHGVKFACEAPTRYHGISGCDPDTGEMKSSGGGFSGAFGAALTRLAAGNDKIVAVCPAMLEGTGLAEFAAQYPDRCVDVGIAEEHALTFAAGLAVGGKVPVCAFYDTFLQRALDAVYHDIALAKLPVVIVADRSGAVPDGPTHHGIYNCGFLRAIPNLTVLAPSSEEEVAPALRFAVSLQQPVVLRYPRGGAKSDCPPVPFELGRAVIRRQGRGDAVIWSCGAEVATALAAAEILANQGIDCTVADARFLKPFDRELALKFAGVRQFAVEDHCVTGGLASALREALDGVEHAPVSSFGWSSDAPIAHGELSVLRERAGLTAVQIAEKIALICKKD